MINQTKTYEAMQKAFAECYPQYRWPKGELNEQDPRFKKAFLMFMADVNVIHNSELDCLKNSFQGIEDILSEEVVKLENKNRHLHRELAQQKQNAVILGAIGWVAAIILFVATVLLKLTM